MQNKIIGFDFSIAKPACTILTNNKYLFYSWPKNLDKKIINILSKTDIKINDNRPIVENKDIAKYDIINGSTLANTIIEDIKEYLTKDTIICFEGSSFGSKGNVTLSITGWRYILMMKLLEYVNIDNFYTYSPITIKSTAGCSKKGLGKPDMIKAFMNSEHNIKLKNDLNINVELFMKKGGKNFIDHLDDIIDSFWVVQTYLKKQELV